jgi:hypothetical protein
MTKGQTAMDSSITYIHSEKASFTSKMIQNMSSLFGVKKGGDMIKKVNQSTSTEVPTPVPKSFIFQRFNIGCSFDPQLWLLGAIGSHLCDFQLSLNFYLLS